MKLFSTSLTPVLIVLCSSSVVRSFQTVIAPPTTTAGIKSIIGTTTPIVVKPRWAPSSFALSSTTKEGATSVIDTNKGIVIAAELQDELLDARQELVNITESLDQAKQQQNEAREAANLLRKEREGVDAESESIIDRLKRGFMEQINDLSDQIEGAQDTARKTPSKTKSDISTIQKNAYDDQAPLREDMSQLENSLNTLKADATTALRERDALNKATRKEAQQIREAARKERDSEKSAASKEKRELTREKWELESRLKQAEIDNKNPLGMDELEEEEQIEPKIPTLKSKLLEMKRKMLPKVDDLKEKRAAKETSYNTSLDNIKEESRAELEFAISVSEEELLVEDQLLKNATASLELQLEANEKELRTAVASSNEAVEVSSSVFSAITGQQQNLASLLKEKLDAISSQESTSAKAKQDMVESQSATQDKYDAKIENSLRNLKEAGSRNERELQNEDKRRANRTRQLTREKEQLSAELSFLLKNEGEAMKRDFKTLQSTKIAELASSASQLKGTKNEIQTMRSNLVFVEGELSRLKDTSEEKQLVLVEMEEERTSFRKQARRTVGIAFGRITRRGRRKTEK